MCRATKLHLPSLPPSPPPMVRFCGVLCRHRDRKIGPTPFLWAAAVCGKNLPVKGDERQGARFSASRGGKVFVRTDQSRPFKHTQRTLKGFLQIWRTIRVLFLLLISVHRTPSIPICSNLRLHPAHPSDITCIPVCRVPIYKGDSVESDFVLLLEPIIFVATVDSSRKQQQQFPVHFWMCCHQNRPFFFVRYLPVQVDKWWNGVDSLPRGRRERSTKCLLLTGSRSYAKFYGMRLNQCFFFY